MARSVTKVSGSVKINVKARHAEFVKSIKENQKRMRLFRRQIQRASKMIKSAFKSITVAVAAMGAGFIVAAKQSGEMARIIMRISRNTGVSVKTINQLKAVVTAFGLEADNVADVLEDLNERLGDARIDGGELKEAIGILGISLYKAGGQLKTTEDILFEVSEALRGLKDRQMAAVLANQIFAENGMRLVGVLANQKKSLKELMTEYGSHKKLTDEQAKSLEGMWRAFNTLKESAIDLKDQAISLLSEDLTTMATNMTTWIESLRGNGDKIIEFKDNVLELADSIALLTAVAGGATVGGFLGRFFGPVGTIAGVGLGGIAGALVHKWGKDALTESTKTPLEQALDNLLNNKSYRNLQSIEGHGMTDEQRTRLQAFRNSENSLRNLIKKEQEGMLSLEMPTIEINAGEGEDDGKKIDLRKKPRLPTPDLRDDAKEKRRFSDKYYEKRRIKHLRNMERIELDAYFAAEEQKNSFESLMLDAEENKLQRRLAQMNNPIQELMIEDKMGRLHVPNYEKNREIHERKMERIELDSYFATEEQKNKFEAQKLSAEEKQLQRRLAQMNNPIQELMIEDKMGRLHVPNYEKNREIHERKMERIELDAYFTTEEQKTKFELEILNDQEEQLQRRLAQMNNPIQELMIEDKMGRLHVPNYEKNREIHERKMERIELDAYYDREEQQTKFELEMLSAQEEQLQRRLDRMNNPIQDLMIEDKMKRRRSPYTPLWTSSWAMQPSIHNDFGFDARKMMGMYAIRTHADTSRFVSWLNNPNKSFWTSSWATQPTIHNDFGFDARKMMDMYASRTHADTSRFVSWLNNPNNNEGEKLRLEELLPVVKEVRSEFEGWFNGMWEGFTNTRDALEDLLGMLAKVAAQRLVVDPLSDVLFGGRDDKGGFLGDILGSVVGVFKGVDYSGGKGIATLASGGLGTQGMALVGEKGPELVDFSRPGMVYNNEQLSAAISGGGRGITIINNISSTDGPGVQNALTKAMPGFISAAQSAVADSARRPGVFRNTIRGTT